MTARIIAFPVNRVFRSEAEQKIHSREKAKSTNPKVDRMVEILERAYAAGSLRSLPRYEQADELYRKLSQRVKELREERERAGARALKSSVLDAEREELAQLIADRVCAAPARKRGRKPKGAAK